MAEVLQLQKLSGSITGRFELPLSKSMVNRALLLAALYPEITLSGMSTSKDSQYLKEVLDGYLGERAHVGDGGTTLRFASAYWACQPGATQELSGTTRLNKRPIAPLVDALNALGGDVRYALTNKEAPLVIHGKELTGGYYKFGHVESSQFITALMLISPKMTQGLHLEWDSVPSQSYLVMTAAILREAGFNVLLTPEEFKITGGQQPKKVKLFMERDWSAAAFWCETVALANKAEIELLGFQKESLQGDSRVLDYFEPLGVKHFFRGGSLFLQKAHVLPLGKFTANLISEPDLAQPLITTLVMQKIPFEINGLQTLVVKESNRIEALSEVAKRFGVELKTTMDSISCMVYPDEYILEDNCFTTYKDHRIAMSLAPISLLFPLRIERPEVVAKSYPEFWQHFAQL
jgi:3-phosphoshikimate 1-carboxyvinyltransferase